MSLKIGELARRTKVSIRTLHYYDEIALISPSEHTESGHRIYSEKDVERLQQILLLRTLGFSLEKIRTFLAEPAGESMLEIIDLHLSNLRQEMEDRCKVVTSLEKIAERLRSKEHPTVDDVLNLMEAMEMIDKYYTPEQLIELKARADAIGETGFAQAKDDWQLLIAEVQFEIESGTDPASEKVKSLARRWLALRELFTGGNKEIANSLQTMYQQEGASKASNGMLDEATMKYIGKAIAALQ